MGKNEVSVPPACAIEAQGLSGGRRKTERGGEAGKREAPRDTTTRANMWDFCMEYILRLYNYVVLERFFRERVTALELIGDRKWKRENRIREDEEGPTLAKPAREGHPGRFIRVSHPPISRKPKMESRK